MVILEPKTLIESVGLTYFRELSSFGALSNEFIIEILEKGVIKQIKRGDHSARYAQEAAEFQILLQGRMAFYKHSSTQDVRTRYINAGEQMGFELMIGSLAHNGINVAIEDSKVLDINSDQFFQLLVRFPTEFGLLMVNLTRELAREICVLEQVIGDTTGWHTRQGHDETR